MDTQQLPIKLLDTAVQHLSASAAWVPQVAAAGLVVLGLVFLVRGGRLAPWVVSLTFLLIGALAGTAIARANQLTVWPAATLSGLAGVLIGLLLFRLWMALQVAALLAAAALAVYSSRVAEPLNSFLTQGFNPETQEVTLLGAAQIPAPDAPWTTQAGALWTHLAAQDPSFQISVIAIVAATGLAGLIFAGLMPSAARSVWAATLGTGMVVTAVLGLMKLLWPAALPIAHRWALVAAAFIWVASVLWNLIDLVGRPRRRAASPEAETKPA